MKRAFHISRLLDIINGSIINGTKVKIQKIQGLKKLDPRVLSKSFREVIDNNLPTIYIIDTSLIEEEVYTYLLNNTDVRLTSKVDTAGGTIFPSDSTFREEYSSELSKKRQFLTSGKLSKQLILNLTKNLGKVSYPELISKANKIFETARNNFAKAEAQKKAYLTYRQIGGQLGADLRLYLNSLGISILTDAQEVIRYNPNTQVIIIGYNFEQAKKQANKVMQETILDFYSKNGIILDPGKKGEGFQVGNIVNAGHTSVSIGDTVLGINMPSGLEYMYRSPDQNTGSKIEQAIAEIPIHVEHSITFDEKYSADAGVFLNLLFSFVVSQPNRLNTVDLNIAERNAISSIVDKTVLPTLEEIAKKKMVGGVLEEIVSGLQNSPTIPEFIELSLLQMLGGTKGTPKSIKKGSIKGQPTDIKIGINKFPDLKKVRLVKPSKSTSRAEIPKLRTTAGRFTSSISLQNLINARLHDQIQQNMGSPALNYHSGRFAQSAQVTGISVSKQGMLTAFYTYMKYPYQTFEPGYAQGSTQRDPRALISRSIREIATSIIGNRMRAVRV